tara:strand:- start:1258 stop:1566 length:309 start_codon:yes stop_codon:yes gene_type:complete
MAEIEFKDNKELENPVLKEVVENENELKSFLVDYVGKKMSPEDDSVTVEMIIETLVDDFPEFVLAVAEENWVRGYQQALTDVDYGKEIAEQQKIENNDKVES